MAYLTDNAACRPCHISVLSNIPCRGSAVRRAPTRVSIVSLDVLPRTESMHSVPLRTYLLSLLLALLTVYPPAYTLGVPSLGSDSPSLVRRLTWVRLFAELS